MSSFLVHLDISKWHPYHSYVVIPITPPFSTKDLYLYLLDKFPSLPSPEDTHHFSLQEHFPTYLKGELILKAEPLSIPVYTSDISKHSFTHQQFLNKFLKFLPDAQAAQSRSKDPSTKVGAIAIDDSFVIRSSGYNGLPRSLKDLPERYLRPIKYKYVQHAEMNVVSQAARTVLEGTTLILTSLNPCTTCTGLLIQAGVKRIIAPSLNSTSLLTPTDTC